MRIFVLSVAACLAACGATTPAHSAGKFACAWEATPNADAVVTGRQKDLPAEAMAHSMDLCGIAKTGENAQKLGLYFSMRHKLGVAAARLNSDYPGALEKLDTAADELTPAERAEILDLGKTRSISQSLLVRLAEITTRAGIPFSDENARPIAQVYLLARVTMAELETQV
jgi:hypothetical protein